MKRPNEIVPTDKAKITAEVINPFDEAIKELFETHGNHLEGLLRASVASSTEGGEPITTGRQAAIAFSNRMTRQVLTALVTNSPEEGDDHTSSALVANEANIGIKVALERIRDDLVELYQSIFQALKSCHTAADVQQVYRSHQEAVSALRGRFNQNHSYAFVNRSLPLYMFRDDLFFVAITQMLSERLDLNKQKNEAQTKALFDAYNAAQMKWSSHKTQEMIAMNDDRTDFEEMYPTILEMLEAEITLTVDSLKAITSTDAFEKLVTRLQEGNGALDIIDKTSWPTSRRDLREAFLKKYPHYKTPFYIRVLSELLASTTTTIASDMVDTSRAAITQVSEGS